ncbi:DUF3293 domain-containing protein [Pseudoxanthomonas dokdonensis]|uniref:DUF3293 domain-containing protein n=1 Tax=Pseudoxanthomonas dokdonensis TaxID=344882 RepID=UPI00070F8651|nr:DUF3293 domain-containing protein [Pseudoxanthomonas dokdonensis]
MRGIGDDVDMNIRRIDGTEAARLAQAWLSAHYAVEAGEDVPFTVDGPLAFRVGGTAPVIERCWPAARYLFITAWNPAAVLVPPRHNQLADARLQQQLRQLRLSMHPASACDAGGGCYERGWLVPQATTAQADRLARAFGQGGVLVWDAGQAVRLRMMWPPPPKAPAHRYIDWAG